MDSVSSTSSPGMASLIQQLSGPGSPLAASGQSSAQIQAELKNASPTDIVQLSAQAVQLQVAQGLLSTPNTPQTSGPFSTASVPSSSTTLSSIIAALSSKSTSSSDSSTPSLSNQISSYQGELQAEILQSLMGTGSTGASGTSLNVLA